MSAKYQNNVISYFINKSVYINHSSSQLSRNHCAESLKSGEKLDKRLEVLSISGRHLWSLMTLHLHYHIHNDCFGRTLTMSNTQ